MAGGKIYEYPSQDEQPRWLRLLWLWLWLCRGLNDVSLLELRFEHELSHRPSSVRISSTEIVPACGHSRVFKIPHLFAGHRLVEMYDQHSGATHPLCRLDGVLKHTRHATHFETPRYSYPTHCPLCQALSLQAFPRTQVYPDRLCKRASEDPPIELEKTR